MALNHQICQIEELDLKSPEGKMITIVYRLANEMVKVNTGHCVINKTEELGRLPQRGCSYNRAEQLFERTLGTGTLGTHSQRQL